MKNRLLFLLLAFTFVFNAQADSRDDRFDHDVPPNVPWAYDAGPDLDTASGRETVNLVAAYPFMPGVSDEILADQKFRLHFGPTFWRMRHTGTAKILFLGQDATHVAEASKRTATAGFGGRAQDFANYFGVDENAAFMNAYQNTIRGQYALRGTPYLARDRNGRPQVRFATYVPTREWLMAQHPSSPMVQWRNAMLDLFFRQNRELKLVVLFGGAANDALGTYIESVGGKVGTYVDEKRMSEIIVPEVKEQYAGGNATFPVPLNKDGRDLYSDLAGRRLDYEKAADQKAGQDAAKARVEDFMKQAVFSEGGPFGNGMIHPAQLGGYDIEDIKINGVKTISLKGLPLSDGSTIGDVLVVQFPHPTYLSRRMMELAEELGIEEAKKEVSKMLQEALKAVKPYADRGWKIEADEGRENQFAAGKPYIYSRADIGPEFYDFGTPGTRMLPESLASRMSRRPDVIVVGTRDRVKFDMAEIDRIAEAQPSEPLDDTNVFTTQPSSMAERAAFDRGPGKYYARLMKENLDLKEIFKTKSGKAWKTDGIAAYNVKNHPDVADFGHYRGTFKSPKVIVLADPIGADDWNTSRALTGARGQHLQGMMNALGIAEDYLVLKTVPFVMDGATDAEWKTVLSQTSEYREKILNSLLQDDQPVLIVADGKHAAAELDRILGQQEEIPVVKIQRGENVQYGLAAAFDNIKKVRGFERARWNGKPANIPRSHLPYGARTVDGAFGDLVVQANDKNRGLAFAVVSPRIAWEQEVKLSRKTAEGISALKDLLKYGGFPMPGEKMPAYLERKANGGAENQMLQRPSGPRRSAAAKSLLCDFLIAG